MAKKPTDAVQFTRESAERIAGVVRAAELTPPAASPLTFGRVVPDQRTRMPTQVRSATFTGAWAIGATNAVTFRYAPTATQVAINLTWPLSGCPLSTTTCIVAEEQGSWLLLSVNLASLPQYNAGKIQMLGHSAIGTAAGCMRWYDITNCSTATAT